MNKFVNFMNGHFGRKHLVRPYRTVWQWMTWGTLAFLFIRFVLLPFFGWWERVVALLNYIIWG